MQTLGIISLSLESEERYITGIASFAKKFGFDIFRITPESVDLEKETAQGLKYNDELSLWEESTFDIPTFIYDRTFYQDEEEIKKFSHVIQSLKAHEKITFLGYGLPNKLAISDVLKHNYSVRPYLPATSPVTNANQVLHKLKKQAEVLLKPVFGSQGNGIFVISKEEDAFIVKTVKKTLKIEKQLSEKQFTKWLQFLIVNYRYLMQPFLQLKTKRNQPFDLRILLQKDEFGNWTERGKGLRLGPENSIISNLAGGGVPVKYNTWFHSLPKEKKTIIQDDIRELTETIPSLLETIFHPLFEIGMDIGIDQDGAIWLLEVNSKPGRNVLLSLMPELEETLYTAPLKYAKFLTNASTKGEISNDQVLSN